MTRHHLTPAGFSLIEVILAVLMTSLAMVGTYWVSSQVMKLADDTKKRLPLSNAALILRTTLENDLTSVIVLEHGNRAVVDSMDFFGGRAATTLLSGHEERLLSLATAATLDVETPFPSQGFYRVEYVLRRDEEAPEHPQALVRRELPFANLSWRDGVALPWRETVLANNVTNCSLTFYPSAETAPLATWDSRTRLTANQTPLPLQIRLTATITEAGRSKTLDDRFLLGQRKLYLGSGS